MNNLDKSMKIKIKDNIHAPSGRSSVMPNIHDVNIRNPNLLNVTSYDSVATTLAKGQEAYKVMN